jgi:hypothetical protein
MDCQKCKRSMANYKCCISLSDYIASKYPETPDGEIPGKAVKEHMAIWYGAEKHEEAIE